MFEFSFRTFPVVRLIEIYTHRVASHGETFDLRARDGTVRWTLTKFEAVRLRSEPRGTSFCEIFVLCDFLYQRVRCKASNEATIATNRYRDKTIKMRKRRIIRTPGLSLTKESLKMLSFA